MLFEGICKNMKHKNDIHKLKGMAKGLGLDDKYQSKDDLCMHIGAELLVHMDWALLTEKGKRVYF